MKFLEETERTGFYPRYNVEEDVRNLCLTYNKPSARILHTDIGLKTLALLKKIEHENNHSWYREILERSKKKGMNDVALFYRGNKITYQEMFDKADKYAQSMASLGVKSGDEIPCCLSNTPELVYIMLAANKMGVKLNLFGTNLEPSYLESILSRCSHKLIFISDVNYDAISSVVNTQEYDNKVVTSLADSLPEHPELCDEYEPELSEYYHYDNYDAIEVPFTELIPRDFDGIMGVPISFLDKYCPDQFEIIWRGGDMEWAENECTFFTKPDDDKAEIYKQRDRTWRVQNPYLLDSDGFAQTVYQRIFIRKKQ